MEKLIIAIIILCVLISLVKIFKKNKKEKIKEFFTSKCWVNNKEFPETEIIFNSKDIILKELNNILNSDKWGIWSNDYKTTPIFTKMTDEEILKRITEKSGKINSTKEPSWRLFGLILNKMDLPNAELYPIQ